MRVDLNKLKELKQKMAELERLMENVVSNATRESIRVTENTRYNYNEYYVRSACEAVLTTARTIERENLRTTQRMQAKIKGLERAIESYMATEKKISGSKVFFNDFFKNFYNRFFKTSIKDSIGTTNWILNTKSNSSGSGQNYGITSSTLRPQFAVGTGKDIFVQSKFINGTAYMKPEALAKAIGANVSTAGMPPGNYWFSKDGTQKKIKAVDGLVPVKIVADHFGVKIHGGSLVSNDTGKVMKNRTVISGSTWAQGTGNVTSGNSGWNQWDASKALSPGNLIDTNAGVFEVAGVAGQKYIPEAIKTTVRPNNIGVGTWNRYIEAEAAIAASKFGTVAKVAKGAGYVAVVADVGFGIYDNFQAGTQTKRIVSDTVVDTAFGGGGLLTSMAVGAGLGTLGCPVVGTVMGGAAAGIVYMVGTEVWNPGGQSVKDRAKEGLYNSIK